LYTKWGGSIRWSSAEKCINFQFLSLIINITIIIAANILKFMMQEINSNHSRKKLWQGVRINYTCILDFNISNGFFYMIYTKLTP
jgi:hypothetical protein